MKSDTAWKSRHEPVKLAADRVRGVRPPTSKSDDPDPDKKTRETVERSYVEMAGHLLSFINRLNDLGGYSPQDDKIAIASFTDLYTALDGYNKAIPVASQALADAIIDRQDTFTGESGLKFVFDGVMGSIKGQYGQTSLQYQAVGGMSW